MANVAVTVVAALTVTVQVPVPAQPPPLQPLKMEPAAGAAVSVTELPVANAAEQVAPQETPAGALVTVPLPAPALLTVSVKDCKAKVAVTEVAALIVTVQVPLPVQPPPLQPLKVEPAAGAAVKVTKVPLVNEAAQVVPQEMPAGLLVTVPLPVPALETVSARVVVETPVPVTSRWSVSPSAVKLTLVLESAVFVGVKRTITLLVAPAARVEGPPEKMLNGAETEAVNVTGLARVFWTVKT